MHESRRVAFGEIWGVKMRKITLALLTSAALGLATESAVAADMPIPRKAPPVVETAYRWGGFYVGGHLGVALSQDTFAGQDFCGTVFSEPAFPGPSGPAPSIPPPPTIVGFQPCPD